jgi:hypothetical protein
MDAPHALCPAPLDSKARQCAQVAVADLKINPFTAGARRNQETWSVFAPKQFLLLLSFGVSLAPDV